MYNFAQFARSRASAGNHATLATRTHTSFSACRVIVTGSTLKAGHISSRYMRISPVQYVTRTCRTHQKHLQCFQTRTAPVSPAHIAEMLSTHSAYHVIAAPCSLHFCSARWAWLCMALKPVLTLLVLLQVLAIDEPLPAAHLRKHSQHRVTKKVTIVRHRQARTSTIFLSHPRRLSPLSAQCKWYLPWCLGQWACLGHIMHTSSSSLKHT